MDVVTARALLERAIAHTSQPSLDEEDVDLLMDRAASEDDEGATVYTDAGLNRAAALGWGWKSGLTADKYDLGGGQGKTLDRSQWFDHCERMRVLYASGEASVVGTTPGSGRTTRGGTIALTSSLAAETETWW